MPFLAGKARQRIIDHIQCIIRLQRKIRRITRISNRKSLYMPPLLGGHQKTLAWHVHAMHTLWCHCSQVTCCVRLMLTLTHRVLEWKLVLFMMYSGAFSVAQSARLFEHWHASFFRSRVCRLCQCTWMSNRHNAYNRQVLWACVHGWRLHFVANEHACNARLTLLLCQCMESHVTLVCVHWYMYTTLPLQFLKRNVH